MTWMVWLFVKWSQSPQSTGHGRMTFILTPEGTNKRSTSDSLPSYQFRGRMAFPYRRWELFLTPVTWPQQDPEFYGVQSAWSNLCQGTKYHLYQPCGLSHPPQKSGYSVFPEKYVSVFVVRKWNSGSRDPVCNLYMKPSGLRDTACS